MGNGEILQFAFAQFLANRGPMPGAMQVQPQQIGLTALSLSGFAGLLVTAGAPMPTLALHLLAQVVLELKRQPSLPTTESLRHPLEVVGAHGGLGQFAQQPHQGRNRACWNWSARLRSRSSSTCSICQSSQRGA